MDKARYNINDLLKLHFLYFCNSIDLPKETIQANFWQEFPSMPLLMPFLWQIQYKSVSVSGAKKRNCIVNVWLK
jgi:hypothetical protein